VRETLEQEPLGKFAMRRKLPAHTMQEAGAIGVKRGAGIAGARLQLSERVEKRGDRRGRLLALPGQTARRPRALLADP
jgi:hypothetical protein